jgi:hypothetical protein
LASDLQSEFSSEQQEQIMTGRIHLGIVCALAIAFGVIQARAQTWQEIAASEEWMLDFTVLTMAPDGSWGVATEPYINRAIAAAIANCKVMSGTELGCGAYLASVRAGWSLGIRCGRENILVADKDLAEAERRAAKREVDLRAHYVLDMPACVRVVTVDPSGRIMPPQVGYSGQIPLTK